ncbi:MAG: hypothetical protein IKF36_04595 [Bacilli bacterium]|nr:hypothetical protein [Bacilli bacterium]
MSTINEKVSIYSDLLKKRVNDPNYIPTPQEKEAEFYVNNDPTLATVVRELKAQTSAPVPEIEDIKPNVVMPQNQMNQVDSVSVLQDIKEINGYTDEEIRKIDAEIKAKNVNISLEDALANIPIYYKTPIKVYNDFKDGVITQEQREFYSDMTTMYADDIAKKKQEEAAAQNQKLVLNGEAGIASIFLLSVVLFVVAVIILLNMK